MCHHAWALQIVMGRNKSYIIDIHMRGAADDIRKDVQRRPDRQKAVRPAKQVPAKVRAKWQPVSLKETDLPLSPTDLTSEDEMSDAFLEAETDWYQSNGLMTHEQFWLHGDEYDDRDKYYKKLEKERVMLYLICCFLLAIH